MNGAVIFFRGNSSHLAGERYALAVMFRSTLLLAALTMLGACHQIEPAPPPLHSHDHGAESANAESASLGAISAPGTEHAEHAHAHEAPAGAIVPRDSVEQVEPGQEALAQAIVAASKPSLDECRGNAGGGTLRLRVVGNKSSAKITIDPGSTVNDKVRHCVLEALSTLDVPDTLSQSSPSMRPSAGFSSIIAVNW
jgi:hypothetical protein